MQFLINVLHIMSANYKFKYLNFLSCVHVHKCQYQLIKSIKYTETIAHQGQEALTGIPVQKCYKEKAVWTIWTMRTHIHYYAIFEEFIFATKYANLNWNICLQLTHLTNALMDSSFKMSTLPRIGDTKINNWIEYWVVQFTIVSEHTSPSFT